MLLVNKKQLPTAIKAPEGHELSEYIKEFHKGMKFFNDEFPRGPIRLNRTGYPKKSKGKLKPVPPFGMPLEWMAENMDKSGSALWSYLEGSPIVLPNGLCDIRETRMWLNGADLVLDWKKNADFAFFVYFKTDLIKTGRYKVKDPEKEAIKRAQARKAKHDLATAIYDGLTDENKLRNVAASWGVDGAFKDISEILREKLEAKVIEMDEKKSKEPNNPQLRGIQEFLEDVKVGDEVRRKALVQYAIDQNKIVYDKFAVKFKWADGRDIVSVDPRYDKIEFLAAYLNHPNQKTTWTGFVRGLIDEDLIERQDKRGLYWLAEQLGFEEKKRTVEELRTELMALLEV
jgi:hypothetical protein